MKHILTLIVAAFAFSACSTTQPEHKTCPHHKGECKKGETCCAHKGTDSCCTKTKKQ